MPNTIVPATGEAVPAASLTLSAKPMFLRDALRMKRERGDTDAETFKEIAMYQYASRLSATISGAAYSMRQWLAKADKLGWSEAKQARYAAFLADLEAIEAGTFFAADRLAA